MNVRSDAICALIKDFERGNVPIDAPNIARLTALGVQVQITELDVSLPVNSSGRSEPGDSARQANIYRGIVRACPNSPGCTAIQSWGFSDKRSWIGSHSRGARGEALPF